MLKLPQPFLEFARRHPAVTKAYEALGQAGAEAGPLDAKTRELVKLGMAIGGRDPGRDPSRRRAGPPTVGCPTTVAVTWVAHVLGRPRTR